MKTKEEIYTAYITKVEKLGLPFGNSSEMTEVQRNQWHALTLMLHWKLKIELPAALLTKSEVTWL